MTEITGLEALLFFQRMIVENCLMNSLSLYGKCRHDWLHFSGDGATQRG